MYYVFGAVRLMLSDFDMARVALWNWKPFSTTLLEGITHQHSHLCDDSMVRDGANANRMWTKEPRVAYMYIASEFLSPSWRSMYV